MAQTRLARIDARIQRGGGKGAKVLGQLFDVRRLSAVIGGSLTNAPPVLRSFAAVLKRTTSRKVIEGATFDLVVFEALCDARVLQIQDLLAERPDSPGYTGARYTCVMRRPPHPMVVVRTDVSAAITRPKPKGGRADQQPARGAIVAPDYLGTNKRGEWPLVLRGGNYWFASPDELAQANPPLASATVMIGLQPNARVRMGTKNNAAGQMPTEIPLSQFLAYVPNLPGESLQERDILNCGNADRYEIHKVYASATVGITGSVCVCEKLPL